MAGDEARLLFDLVTLATASFAGARALAQLVAEVALLVGDVRYRRAHGIR